ncbi:hypothetical protein WMY93_033888 [Mugilogobius chulae]|uniref:Uncharacterized protein n=1 Tax=Mugilogobius chulae TaxID=88201 RepID=A0AAW0MJA9_9GOBI
MLGSAPHSQADTDPRVSLQNPSPVSWFHTYRKPHPPSSSIILSTKDFNNRRDKMEKIFSKYMNENNKLSDGPPARYQLKVEQVNLDDESKLRKFTLEKRNFTFQPKPSSWLEQRGQESPL